MSAIEVILVDKNDTPTGKMEKLEVHEKGLLHRAVTVYVFNRKGEFLLQRRAASKYHCGGLWSNTCCGHPFPGEGTQQAAERRLREEMGLRLSLHPVFEISYNMPLHNGLTEHEYGHIFFGITDEPPVLNIEEADAWRYSNVKGLQREMAATPERFTPWFIYTLSEAIAHHPAFMAADPPCDS